MILKPGDRVEHAAADGAGTVQYCDSTAVQVRWDGHGQGQHEGWLYYRRDCRPNAFGLLRLVSTLNKAR